MAKWKHYELWTQTSASKWEMIGIFPDPKIPSFLANLQSTPSRLIEVLFEDSQMLSQEVIAEIGNLLREKRLSAPARKPGVREPR